MNPASPPEADTPGAPHPPASGSGRGLLFRTLAILWVLPTLGALVILFAHRVGADPAARQASDGVPVERIIAATLVAIQAALILLAWNFRSEAPRR